MYLVLSVLVKIALSLTESDLHSNRRHEGGSSESSEPLDPLLVYIM